MREFLLIVFGALVPFLGWLLIWLFLWFVAGVFRTIGWVVLNLTKESGRSQRASVAAVVFSAPRVKMLASSRYALIFIAGNKEGETGQEAADRRSAYDKLSRVSLNRVMKDV